GVGGVTVSNPTGPSRCGSGRRPVTSLPIDATLQAIGPGQNVFRAWFYQYLATSYGTGGGRDWTAFDRTLAAARGRGQRVIATLGDQWGLCEGPDTPAYKNR